MASCCRSGSDESDENGTVVGVAVAVAAVAADVAAAAAVGVAAAGRTELGCAAADIAAAPVLDNVVMGFGVPAVAGDGDGDGVGAPGVWKGVS